MWLEQTARARGDPGPPWDQANFDKQTIRVESVPAGCKSASTAYRGPTDLRHAPKTSAGGKLFGN
jgi:hypothetical protein